jgi:tetratricopeptide (TPR) repeat protein
VIGLFLAGSCATVGLQSEFLAGRQALLKGEPDNALQYFDRVARGDPSFVSDSTSPRRSIWTYVGRARYNSGRYSEAKTAFERALTYLADDNIARLYLGLTLLPPATSPASTNAFTLQEVTYALREGVEPRRVAALARERGVAFDLTKETESQLRGTGADTYLVNELRNLRALSLKQYKASDNQRIQAGKELTAALTGLRDWLEFTVTKSPQGQFWDPSQEIRKQLQIGLAQLAARPIEWDAVISNGEGIGYMFEEESDRARRDEAAERNRQQRR